MRRQLLIFTTSYPYGTGEPFIEPELEAACRVFERVLIFPGFGIGPMRSVPSKAEVLAPLWGSPFSRAAFYLRHALRWSTLKLAAAEYWRSMTTYQRFHVAVLYRIWLWAIYRRAYETSTILRSAALNPEDYVAYCFWAHTPAMAAPYLAAAGIPVAVRYHSVDLYLHGRENAAWIHRNAQFFPWREEVEAASDISIFVSDQGQDYFARHWPTAKSSKKVVARLGVRGGYPVTRSMEARQRSSEGSLLMVSCSSIVALKRVSLIARFAIAMARRRPVVWHHFGGGSDDEVRHELFGQPDTLSVTLHGHVENVTVLRFYQTFAPDLFVNFSTREGIPVSIMEALSCDIPVVATAVGGTPEAVVTGESGLLIDVDECNDSARLAECVLHAMAPGGEIFRANPRRMWIERFDARSNSETVAEILKSLGELAPISTGHLGLTERA